MGHIQIAVETAHATAYDASYPTRSTENYAHCLHEILQDMEDQTQWYIRDGSPSTTLINTHCNIIYNMVDAVFDYADGAITTYRSTGTPTLVKPTATSPLTRPVASYYAEIWKKEMEVYTSCMKVCYLIYYMWKTEEDPLLLKEKLQELLVAWPLTDSEIFLNEDGGQSIHIVPAWKNVDL